MAVRVDPEVVVVDVRVVDVAVDVDIVKQFRVTLIDTVSTDLARGLMGQERGRSHVFGRRKVSD